MAESSSSGCLRALDTAIVTPSGPPLPPSSLPLTFLDVQWINSPPVERIFFYRLIDPNMQQHIPAILSTLKDSLSTALRLFFPLAGHVRITPGTTPTHHDILYEPGDGVAFTLAEYDADVSDLSSNEEPRQVTELAQLVPRLTTDGGVALLAVQATVLREGLALGVTVHHVVCDGAGSTNLLHTWAAACTGAEEFPTPPVIDRTLISDHQGLYEYYTKNLLSTEQIEFVKMSPDQLLATFTISREHLLRIKDVVASEAARHDHLPPRCSTLVAALGFIWSCYCRAKAETDWSAIAGSCTEPTYFIVPVNHRPWMKPPVPATYLGNCIGPAIGAAPKKELASGGVGGLFTACAAIATGIEKVVATPEWETLTEHIKEVGARGVLSVAGSPRFRVYDMDFGFGRPVKVEIVSVARTGAMAVAESDGMGMEVGISLPPAGMEVFRRCFADAILGSHGHTTREQQEKQLELILAIGEASRILDDKQDLLGEESVRSSNSVSEQKNKRANLKSETITGVHRMRIMHSQVPWADHYREQLIGTQTRVSLAPESLSGDTRAANTPPPQATSPAAGDRGGGGRLCPHIGNDDDVRFGYGGFASMC